MYRFRVLIAVAFAASPLLSQNLIPLPKPAAPRDSAAADSVKTSKLATDSSDDTVSYSAVRIRFRSDHFSLADKALLKYQGSSLLADSIVYYPHDDVVEALGAPLLEDKTDPPILGTACVTT